MRKTIKTTVQVYPEIFTLELYQYDDDDKHIRGGRLGIGINQNSQGIGFWEGENPSFALNHLAWKISLSRGAGVD